MSLSRKLLESLGLEADKVSTIIEAHAETVEALKAQIATYKTDAEQKAATEAELITAKKELEELKATGGDWQTKFEKERDDFAAYKAAQEAKETQQAKEKAYKGLLRKAGVSEKRLDSIIRVTDLSAVEFDNGAFKNEADIEAAIANDWGDFITQTSVEGVKTATPPASNPQTKYTKEDIKRMSAEEINKNWDAISASLSSKGE